jgi:hypothetical protein
VNFLVAMKLSSDFDQVQISINYKKIILKFFVLSVAKMVPVLEEQQIGQNGTCSSKSNRKNKMVPVLARATDRTKNFSIIFL